MKQKRNSHIRKSNYHPPKTQAEKTVQRTMPEQKKKHRAYSSQEEKAGFSLKRQAASGKVSAAGKTDFLETYF